MYKKKGNILHESAQRGVKVRKKKEEKCGGRMQIKQKAERWEDGFWWYEYDKGRRPP